MSYDWPNARLLFKSASSATFYQFNTTHGYPSGGSSGLLSFSGSMEGDLQNILPGSWVNGGYHYSDSITPPPTYTFVGAQISLPVSCVHGSTNYAGTIVVPLNNGPYTSATTGWYPWKDQGSTNPLPWQGAVQAPDFCNGGPMFNSKGATFSATVTSKSSASINVQFHYRVPAAKNSPNTNCMDPTNPNAYVASICQASESSTQGVVPVPPINQTIYFWNPSTSVCSSQNSTVGEPVLFANSVYWSGSSGSLTATALGSLSGAASLSLDGNGFPSVYTLTSGATYTFSNCATASFQDSDFYVPNPCPPEGSGRRR